MKTLLTMSLTGGVMALVVMLVRAIFGKKLHPRLIYLLWLPVLLSLLIPLRFESPIALRNAPTVRYVEQSVAAKMDAPIAYDIPVVPWQEEGHASVSTDVSVAVGTTPEGTKEVEIKKESRAKRVDAWDVAAVVWTAGAAFVGGYIAWVNLRFYGRIRRSYKAIAVPWIVARQMGDMKVFVSRVVPSPCLVGVVRPFVVVTPQALEDETRFVHVLTHERMHRAQGDPVWSLLRTAALILHWFNPIVWIAASLSRFDCENACDALTIRALGEEQRVDYGKTLLAFLRAKPTATALVNTATTMAQSRRQIRRRISLIAKKQRYAWIVAVLAVVLTLTGCALTMTAPESSDAPYVEIGETPPPQPAEEMTAAAPAPASVALDISPQMKEYVLAFEKALEPYVSDFVDMEWAHIRERVPEFADFELYGRQNADGDVYMLVKLPVLQNASKYQDVWISTWQEEQGTLIVERNGTLEDGNLVRLERYELHGLMIADIIESYKDELVLICEGSDPVLADLHTLSAIRTELFIRGAYPGASSIRPRQGSYLAVPMLNSATMQATGWSTAITAYLPVEEDLLEGLVFETLEDKNLKDFWEDTECMSMIRLHDDGMGENYVMLGSDRLVRYEDHASMAVCRQNVYYERFHGIISETFGIDPFFYLHSKSFNSPENAQITSASLVMLDHETGEVLSASTTDGQSLKRLHKLVFEPDDILTGGAGCPFGGILTLQTTEGEFTFHVATDSCGVLCYEGNVYLDYGDQADLFEIFPACDPYSSVNFMQKVTASVPVTLEVLVNGADEWEIYEADQSVQELYELILTKMESSEGEMAKNNEECLYELDFRDENVARILPVQVRAESFVVDGRVYPDKKRELLTRVEALTE